ncbi:hypothetical protein ACIRPQ_29075 [Streptomyces sp. NPDC101213]|uniref:hypothetical protein n=1 Tax=Streptomyces sp. NPDC101213 TaxID=3366130 RepID=UPI003810508A
MTTYHRPRHPCAGQDSTLAQRARTRLAPRPAGVPAALAALGRALAGIRPTGPVEPKNVDDLYRRLREHCAALPAAPHVTDVATLAAAMRLTPAAVPLLRQALQKACHEGLAERMGRSAHGEMLFRLLTDADATVPA